MNNIFAKLLLPFISGLAFCAGIVCSKSSMSIEQEKTIAISTKKEMAHENNVVCYDYLTNRETEFYFENFSYDDVALRASQLSLNQGVGALKVASSTNNGWTRVSDVGANPNRWIAYLSAGNMRGTAFFIGPNLLLTAGHCMMIDNYNFVPDAKISPGFDSVFSNPAPKGDFHVKKVYVSKRYKTARAENDPVKNAFYDWAVLEIEEDDNLTDWLGGWFGKVCNYRIQGASMKTVGYPYINSRGQMWKNDFVVTRIDDADDPSDGTMLLFNREAYSGASGSPVYIYDDGSYYAAAILTGATSCGVLINDFIYRFTNSLLANRYIEVRDHWFDSNMQINYYNCVVETIAKPDDQNTVYLSKDESTLGVRCNGLTKVFCSTSTSSTFADDAYIYFRLRSRKNGLFSEKHVMSDFFSEDEMSAKYKTIGRTKNGRIANTFDSTGNVWNHGAPIGSKIKGSIVYGGEARNIECSVPWIGYSAVSSVECGGKTFYLRAGPNRVSIRAESEVETDSSTFFAFGRD